MQASVAAEVDSFSTDGVKCCGVRDETDASARFAAT